MAESEMTERYDRFQTYSDSLPNKTFCLVFEENRYPECSSAPDKYLKYVFDTEEQARVFISKKKEIMGNHWCHSEFTFKIVKLGVEIY